MGGMYIKQREMSFLITVTASQWSTDVDHQHDDPTSTQADSNGKISLMIGDIKRLKHHK